MKTKYMLNKKNPGLLPVFLSIQLIILFTFHALEASNCFRFMLSALSGVQTKKILHQAENKHQIETIEFLRENRVMGRDLYVDALRISNQAQKDLFIELVKNNYRERIYFNYALQVSKEAQKERVVSLIEGHEEDSFLFWYAVRKDYLMPWYNIEVNQSSVENFLNWYGFSRGLQLFLKKLYEKYQKNDEIIGMSHLMSTSPVFMRHKGRFLFEIELRKRDPDRFQILISDISINVSRKKYGATLPVLRPIVQELAAAIFLTGVRLSQRYPHIHTIEFTTARTANLQVGALLRKFGFYDKYDGNKKEPYFSLILMKDPG